MDMKEKNPCLQRLTLHKLVMGQEDPNQGHELETEAPEHGQCGPTEMNTYREKKSRLRKIPWLTPQLLSTAWEFEFIHPVLYSLVTTLPSVPSRLLPLSEHWGTKN